MLGCPLNSLVISVMEIGGAHTTDLAPRSAIINVSYEGAEFSSQW